MVPVTGSLLGKNREPNTSAAAEPYRKKSYHSTAVPIIEANTTLAIGVPDRPEPVTCPSVCRAGLDAGVDMVAAFLSRGRSVDLAVEGAEPASLGRRPPAVEVEGRSG